MLPSYRRTDSAIFSRIGRWRKTLMLRGNLRRALPVASVAYQGLGGGVGLGLGVGRGLGEGVGLGVAVAVGVGVGVAVDVGVGVTLGVGVAPPVTSRNAALIGPHVW